MSKNLESEYKNFINDQIPDLWDRIEAGLGKQDEPVNTTVSLSGRSSRRLWKPILGIAAAAACVCILVPMALSIGSGSMGGSMTASAVRPGEENYKEAAAAAEAPAEYPEVYEEAVEMYEEAAAEAAPEEAWAYDSEEAAFEPYEEKAEAAAAEAYEPDESELAEASALGMEEESADEAVLSEEYILNKVEFEISGITEEELAENKLTAQIHFCPDDASFEGRTVTLHISDTENPSLPDVPGTYTGTLLVTTDEKNEEFIILLNIEP